MITIRRFKLAPYQEAFLNNPHRFTAVEASTKAGKTAGAIQWGVEQWHDFTKPVGWETTWCAPVYEQAKIAFKRIKRALPVAYDVNDSSLTCFTPRGDELRFKSADDVNNLYGPDARAVVFEEFTRSKNVLDAFMALRSTLTKTKGKMKLIGNFIGNANAGHQLALAHSGDPEWAHFIVTAQMAVDAGILDQAELDQARKDLPPYRFMALYMCQGGAHPLQMMNSDAINDLWTNTPKQLQPKCIVVDVAGQGRDKTVISLWNGLLLEHLTVMDQSGGPEVVAAIAQLASIEGVRRHNIVVDADGIGGMGVCDYMPGCVRFHGGGKIIPRQGDEKANYFNLRAQCYFTLAEYVNDGSIGISKDLADHRDTINIELEAIRRNDDVAEGKLKVCPKDEIKQNIGRSPDFADVFMMRMALDLHPESKALENMEDRIKRQRYRRSTEPPSLTYPRQ